jgi:hypothetical protein
MEGLVAKTVYLAGPMSGRPFCNFPLFFAYEKMLTIRGYVVWSPARNDIKKHGDFWQKCPTGSRAEMDAAGVKNLTYRTALKDDFGVLFDTADAIAMMPGWRKSKGAATEHALALCLGLEIIYLEKLQ